MKPIKIWAMAIATIAGIVAGCHDSTPKSDASSTASPPKHEHKPPHGGTPVELGEEEYHVELVLDAPTGRLEAYVLDGELEKFVRISMDSFVVTAKLPGHDETLTFQAVPNSATGEKVGDTSLFEAKADWLKTVNSFDATLKQLTVKGKSYGGVSFNFPKGNDQNEKPKP